MESELQPELKGILDRYTDIFEEPKDLPPHRSSDHRIPLQPVATLISGPIGMLMSKKGKSKGR